MSSSQRFDRTREKLDRRLLVFSGDESWAATKKTTIGYFQNVL